MSMSSLPAELLLDIFGLACTDAGHTGCSLRVVSQQFNTLCTSSGIDIQNVALHGVDKMKAFVTMLEGREEDGRRVNHLFLTERPTQKDLSHSTPVMLCARILQSISQRDLRVLTIHLPRHQLAPTITSLSFPALTDLTLYAGLDIRFFDTLQPCLSLQRLHIAAHHRLPCNFAVCLGRIAPQLTHLKVSGITSSSSSGDLPDALRTYSGAMLGSDGSFSITSVPPSVPAPVSTEDSSHELPASVQTIIIGFATFFQTTGLRRSGGNRRQIEYFQTAQALRQLSDDHHYTTLEVDPNPNGKVDRRKIVVHDPPTVRDADDVEDVARENYDRLRVEWEESVRGEVVGWDAVHSSIPSS